MAFKIFGWRLSRDRTDNTFTADDRMAAFILMAMTERVNRLFSSQGFCVKVTESERSGYMQDGKVPYHIAVAAGEFRRRFLSRIYCLLHDDEAKDDSLDLNIIQQIYRPVKDSELCSRVRAAADSWQRTASGIPFFALFDYLPLRLDKEVQCDETAERHRQLVWNFKYNPDRVSPRKHVTAIYEVVYPLADKLNEVFAGVGDKLTLFCIPASDAESQWLRYREFTRMLCRLTGMTDSFGKVSVTGSRIPKHLGGECTCNYELDTGWFCDRLVVVFDDVLTTGASLDGAVSRLQEAGAVVVAACFLGHTTKNED